MPSIHAPLQGTATTASSPMAASHSKSTGGTHTPYLSQPLLHLHNISSASTEKEIASYFEAFRPIRLTFNRQDSAAETVSGAVEFKEVSKAEKAYATVRSQAFTFAPLPGAPSAPSAKPRIVNSLPKYLDSGHVYDLFRPSGPIAQVAPHRLPSGAVHQGAAIVQFWSEGDARLAETRLHCSLLDNMTISVSIYGASQPISGRSNSPTQSTTSLDVYRPVSPSIRTSPRGSAASIYAQQSQIELNEHTQTVTDFGIDPCNLFCKGLDSSIGDTELLVAFQRHGRVKSARVMKDDQGNSRGFGFVSFEEQISAARAIESMNGSRLGSKSIYVNIHEPKAVRHEKLAKLFGTKPPPAAQVEAPDSPTDDKTFSRDSLSLPSTDVASQKSFDESHTPGQAISAATSSQAPAQPASERERLLKAVSGMVSAGPGLDDLTDLLISLPKKDRALMLFNADYLRTKVDEAREILEMTGDESGREAKNVRGLASSFEGVHPPNAPVETDQHAVSSVDAAAVDVSSEQQVSEPPISSTDPSESPYTLSSFCSLSNVEIVSLIQSSSPLLPPSLILSPLDADSLTEHTTFFQTLLSSPSPTAQKQALGDHLFRTLKQLGFTRGVAKLTIALLDEKQKQKQQNKTTGNQGEGEGGEQEGKEREELIALGLVMKAWPQVLKEKATILAAVANK